MKKTRKSASLVIGLAIASASAVLAAAAQSPADPAGASSTQAVPAPAAANADASSTAAAPAAASAVTATVHPGPLEEARKVLLNRILQAKAEGVGIANYQMAHTAIEEMIKSGATEEQIKPRVLSLATALRDQENRSKILKTQRPLPPTSSQQAGAGGGGPMASGAAPPGSIKDALSGGGGSDEILQRLKDKLGSGDLQIPDNIKDKVLNSEKGKKLLEKLGGL